VIQVQMRSIVAGSPFTMKAVSSFRPSSLASATTALKLLALFAAILLATWARADDLSSQYQWKPVRIGAGGWVVGMVLHPLDPTVRYARTDVGNGYRWDDANQQWIPMRVSNPDGSGIQSASETGAPSGYGIESIAIDPTNKSVVYLVFPTEHSTDILNPTNFAEIYKSVDGGKNFVPGNMTAAAILSNPNGPNRMYGEKLMVDPANTSVLYYGSDSQGLFRSLDGGATWKLFGGSSAPPTDVEFVNIQFAKGPGTTTVNGVVATKTLYAISVKNGSDAGGDVYETQDGGQTWTDISTGVTDTASGFSLSHQALSSSIDTADALYIPESTAINGWHRAYWRYAAGKWTRFTLEGSGGNSINQAVVSVAADPTNPQRIYALGADTSLARSDTGGASWINLGSPQYANTLGWLPQTVGMSGGQWHSNGGIKLDSAGNLWTPTGQEGPLTIASASAIAATTANPPKWTIEATGIEEMVTMDMTVPPGSNDTILALAMDTTGFTIPDPDNFSAVQIPLQKEIISQGTTVAYAPDAPSYIAVTSSNVNTNGPSYSGYSTDGGKTWTRFGSTLQYACGAAKCDIPAGMIAVGLRGSRSLGSDHIVLYPPVSLAPEYSQDGGATWHVTTSFPLLADGMTIDTSQNYLSFTYTALNQHLLRADPFTADKFYLKFTHAPQSLYISTDGGKTWQGQPGANLPDNAWSGQLVVNEKAKGDLWYADGWAGSSPHGVFHSTDGGQTFQQVAGISHAVTIAVGAGSGNSGDAAYSVYFYGLLTSDPQWGIFRSTNGGSSWDRVSYYPTGIYDTPRAMAASQDTFGKVYLGFSGNSFVYGQVVATAPALPGAPTQLSATGVADTEIDLSWLAPSGVVSGYSVYRGTTPGGESSTPLATGLAAKTYADKSVTKGTAYYYTVTATNSVGQGPSSNEASAKALQPAISLAVATGGSSSATVTQGQAATFQLALASSNYAGTVTFTCAGAPTGYTCTVPSPAAITLATSTTPVTVSVQTGSASAALATRPFHAMICLAAACLILPLCFRRRSWARMAVSIAAGSMLIAVGGCGSAGSGSSAPAKQPVVSTLVISASGASVTTSTTSLTLTVQ